MSNIDRFILEHSSAVSVRDVLYEIETKDILMEDSSGDLINLGELLKCTICGEICKRAVNLSCCSNAICCRPCGTKKLTQERKCWMDNCGKPGLKTTEDDLKNNEEIRDAVVLYKKKVEDDQKKPENEKEMDKDGLTKSDKEVSEESGMASDADTPSHNLGLSLLIPSDLGVPSHKENIQLQEKEDIDLTESEKASLSPIVSNHPSDLELPNHLDKDEQNDLPESDNDSSEQSPSNKVPDSEIHSNKDHEENINLPESDKDSSEQSQNTKESQLQLTPSDFDSEHVEPESFKHPQSVKIAHFGQPSDSEEIRDTDSKTKGGDSKTTLIFKWERMRKGPNESKGRKGPKERKVENQVQVGEKEKKPKKIWIENQVQVGEKEKGPKERSKETQVQVGEKEKGTKGKEINVQVGEKEKTKGKRGRKPKIDFKCTAALQEDAKAPLYSVAVCPFKARNGAVMFATAGINKVTLYESFGNGEVKVVKCFEDPDTEESFYTLAWGYDRFKKKPILAAGGESGTIRLMCPYQKVVVKTIHGHMAVNDLKFHPLIHELLLSASRDRTLKLYNVQTDHLVAIFGLGGEKGHEDEVLSCDINMEGDKMVSGSMDHNIKIWCMNNDAFNQKIKLSQTYDEKKEGKAFDTLVIAFPLFTTKMPKQVHNNFVDCCRFFGNFILSKTCLAPDNSIKMWQPSKPINETCTSFGFKKKPIYEFSIHDCEFKYADGGVWFLRFAMDIGQTTLAVGNDKGKTSVWNLDVDYAELELKPTVLSHPLCKATIRQTALSKDGKLLICVCDDGTIWHWEKNTKK